MLELKALKKALMEQQRNLDKLRKCDDRFRLEHLEDMLYGCERLTVYLRQCISMCPQAILTDGFNDLSDQQYGISVDSKGVGAERVFFVTLPFLLPNRRTAVTGFKRTIAEAVHNAIFRYCKAHDASPFDKASVTFISFYAPSEERKMRHDNDNTEVSVILNALTGLLISDDSSLCCDLHLVSRTAEKSYTKIIIKCL